MKPRYAYSPFRVEASPGELLVVDDRDLVVAGFSTDPDDLENISRREVENRVYGFAAMPEIYDKARAFLDAMADPNLQTNEDFLLKCADELEAALAKADVPPPPEPKEEKKANGRKPLG